MKDNIIRYARAGYAGLFLCTAEEVRAEAEVKAAAEDLGRNVHAWSITTGMMDAANGSIHQCTDPVEALGAIESLHSDCIVVLRDFGPLLEDKDPLLIRMFRETLAHARSAGKLIVLIGVWKQLPAELEREITRIDFDLPDKPQLGTILDAITESAKLPLIGNPNRDPILEAAGGLTTMEAENAFALSIVETGDVDAAIVGREKANALRSGGLLEVIDAPATLDDIGGLNAMKEWLIRRREAFTQRARDYGLPIAKGMLVLGVPGTGKSLTAKATASVFGIPLLKLDAGKLFGGIVGQSEANLRTVIQTAEAISPCVLWIDEIEKGFGGMGSSNSSTDGGTSSRVFGTMLNWLQDKTKPVFVVATANDVSKLPPELLRKGRWDELWFVDLPNSNERSDIWDIVIGKYGREKADFDTVVLARASELHTGAEIEAAFVESLHRCFTQDREPTELDIGEVLCDSVPLATTMNEEIERLRHWSKTRARHATHAEKSANGKRKLDLS